MRAFTELRNVQVDLSNHMMPIDAFKAVGKYAEKLETAYENSLDENGVSQGLVDLAGTQVILHGAVPKIHVFTVTTDFANATYTLTYVETVPTVEDIT